MLQILKAKFWKLDGRNIFVQTQRTNARRANRKCNSMRTRELLYNMTPGTSLPQHLSLERKVVTSQLEKNMAREDPL